MQESRYLKDNLENIQRLMAIPALRNFETSNLSRLLHLSKMREYDPNETIIQEGDEDPWLYFLLEGSVRITKKDVEIGVITEIGPNLKGDEELDADEAYGVHPSPAICRGIGIGPRIDR